MQLTDGLSGGQNPLFCFHCPSRAAASWVAAGPRDHSQNAAARALLGTEDRDEGSGALGSQTAASRQSLPAGRGLGAGLCSGPQVGGQPCVPWSWPSLATVSTSVKGTGHLGGAPGSSGSGLGLPVRSVWTHSGVSPGWCVPRMVLVSARGLCCCTRPPALPILKGKGNGGPGRCRDLLRVTRVFVLVYRVGPVVLAWRRPEGPAGCRAHGASQPGACTLSHDLRLRRYRPPTLLPTCRKRPQRPSEMPTLGWHPPRRGCVGLCTLIPATR